MSVHKVLLSLDDTFRLNQLGIMILMYKCKDNFSEYQVLVILAQLLFSDFIDIK